MRVEQLEAWSKAAAKELKDKLGAEGTVIVMTMLNDGANFSAWQGANGGVIFLLETASRAIKDVILPKATIK